MRTIWKPLPREYSRTEILQALEEIASGMNLKYLRFRRIFRSEKDGRELLHYHFAMIIPPQTMLVKIINRIYPPYVIEAVTAPIKETQDNIGFDIYVGDEYSLLSYRKNFMTVTRKPFSLQIPLTTKAGLRIGAVLDDVVNKLSNYSTRTS
jgi:hypothetical protein